MSINVIEFLENTVLRFPDKVGFEDKYSTCTFSDFKKRALNISNAILNYKSCIKMPVGIYLPKSIDALVSFAGTLYSGNIYVPLDVKSPEDRVKAILDNIEPFAVITDSKNKAKLEKIFDTSKIILLDEIAQISSPKCRFNENIDTDAAYIINTSGSTGVPKGVTISHRSIIDYIEWAKSCYDIDEKTVMGNQAPFYFDNSVLDIYMCFATGFKLIITPEDLFVFPIKLLEYFKEKNVDSFFFVPSVMVNIANMNLLDKILPPFKNILFAGEIMPTKQLNYWISKYPNATFSNLYGPTEITVDCTYYTVNRAFRDDEPLPIGKPCRNSDVLILDGDVLVSEPNKSGELCVRGSSLALGYYNNFEKTNAVFTQNPLNTKYPEKIYHTGDIVHYNDNLEIIFEGRKDFQIKHMGYRIELGEIETALGAIEELENVCVVYNLKKAEIVLFYVAKSEISVRDLVCSLGKSIPKYMIPTRLIKMDSLPLNSNGKIDRKALISTL